MTRGARTQYVAGRHEPRHLTQICVMCVYVPYLISLSFPAFLTSTNPSWRQKWLAASPGVEGGDRRVKEASIPPSPWMIIFPITETLSASRHSFLTKEVRSQPFLSYVGSLWTHNWRVNITDSGEFLNLE